MRGKTTFHIRWKLFFYDVIVFAVTSVFLLVLYEGPVKLTQRGELQQMLLAFVCVFACRLVGKIYGQIRISGEEAKKSALFFRIRRLLSIPGLPYIRLSKDLYSSTAIPKKRPKRGYWRL